MQAYGKTNIFITSLYVFLTRAFQKRKWSFVANRTENLLHQKQTLAQFVLKREIHFSDEFFLI
jgi:hypothetical protein